MKDTIKNVFLVVSILVVLLLGYQIYSAYMVNHTYYYEMLGSSSNWKGVLVALLFSLLPVSYLVLSSKKNILVLVSLIFMWLFLFWLSFISIKDSILGWGWVMLFINFLIIFFLAIYFVSGLLMIWSEIKRLLFKLDNNSIFDVFISFWLGLSVFNIFNYILIVTDTFYSIISWIIFLWFWALVYYRKENFLNMVNIIASVFAWFNVKSLQKNNFVIVPIILIIFSLMYYYFGFIHSYIPYPTAWDANHAYLFYPKMFAYNHWYYWNEPWMWSWADLWSSYIAYWFNLFIPLEWFWISPDTFAVEMNFLSWIFVLLFWLALVKEVLEFVSIEWDRKEVAFYLGWFLLIIWLSSWMWAFLVFVDNKTDLWIMTLIILSVYSWFMFLKKNKEEELISQNVSLESVDPVEKRSILSSSTVSYLIISGFLYAVAVLAKPTALFDVVKFSMFMAWNWIGILWVLWIFFAIIWMLWIAKFRWIAEYISPELSKYIFGLGVLSTLVWTWTLFIKNKVKYLIYVLIWWLVFFVTVLVLKWSLNLALTIKSNSPVKPFDIIKNMFIGYEEPKVEKPKLLLASTTNTPALEKVLNEIGLNNTWATSTTWTTQVKQLDYAKCSLESAWTTKENLYKDLKKAPWDTFNEDVGRYIWFWWREFKNPWWKVFIPANNSCIWVDKSAVILCNNEKLVTDKNIEKLKELLPTLNPSSKGYELLSKLVNNSGLVEDNIRDIQSFYQDRAIKVSNNVVSVPFRFLTPFNVSFNWSLQNLSSYYTDIWFIWLITLFLIVVWLVYSIVIYDRFLIWISLVTIFGWVLWSLIGWWILWYDIGLIVWTIIGFCVYVHTLSKNWSKKLSSNILLVIFVLIFVTFGLYQLLLNFIRISSQWGSGPFMWYKQTNWNVYQINWASFSSTETLKSPYVWTDVFNLQFPHYNKFIELANNRGNDVWIFLAWTYARYFIKNQNNIIYDQFLTTLWENFSDNDPCKSYLRLKDKKLKYIAIDPNIWTVVMWGGNKSLFDRFFAKINNSKDAILEHWVISMLANLYKNGYLNYISSNNIWAIYAFKISDEELRSYINKNITDQDLTIIRASLPVARYPDIHTLTEKYFDMQQWLLVLIMNIMNNRVSNWSFVYDMADIYGKKLDETRMNKIINLLMTKSIGNEVMQEIWNLSVDEKFVFVQFLNLYYIKQKDPKQYNEVLQKVLMDSIGSSSQIIVLEVK